MSDLATAEVAIYFNPLNLATQRKNDVSSYLNRQYVSSPSARAHIIEIRLRSLFAITAAETHYNLSVIASKARGTFTPRKGWGSEILY